MARPGFIPRVMRERAQATPGMSRNSWQSYASRPAAGHPPRVFVASWRSRKEGELLGTFEGVVEGTIVDAPRGSGGFGYDPVFQPLGFDQTFARAFARQEKPNQPPGAGHSITADANLQILIREKLRV